MKHAHLLQGHWSQAMLKYAFLETNAVSYATHESICGQEIRNQLNVLGYEPVVGQHTVYELAKTFLVDKKQDLACKFFQTIMYLEPKYGANNLDLINQELHHFFSYQHQYIKPFLSINNLADAKNEVRKLATANFDDNARNFIQDRETRFKADHPQSSGKNIDLFKISPPPKCIKTFEDFNAHYQISHANVLVKILKNAITIEQARAVLASAFRYPAIRSCINAQMYFMFIAAIEQVCPAKDKVDDYRHVVDAAYCDAIITNDGQLLNNTFKINPHLTVLTWENCQLAKHA